MNAHTPGPWAVKADRWIVATRGEHAGEIIAAPTYWMDNAFAEGCANARLIAAAPELIKVLKAMVDWEVEYMTINKLGDPEKQHNVKWARAVLAKAEGRKPDDSAPMGRGWARKLFE